MSKKIAIIGSGFAGLSASCYLARKGFQVTVFEKNEQVGGRAGKMVHEGFTFDMGPSWYWMPDIFEKFFKNFAKVPSDYFTLERLDPAYQVYFSKDDSIIIPGTIHEVIRFF